MTKDSVIILLLITGMIGACGGSLSKEQREAMKEGMNLSRIKKVSESALFQAALDQGQHLKPLILGFSKLQIDSVASKEQVLIHWHTVSASPTSWMEKEVLQAYKVSEAAGQDLVDGLQGNSEGDTLMYSIPIQVRQENGSKKLSGVWTIVMSRKQLILDME